MDKTRYTDRVQPLANPARATITGPVHNVQPDARSPLVSNSEDTAMAQKAERFVLSRLAWFGTITLAALTLYCLFTGNHLTAAAALITAGIVWTSPALPRARSPKLWQLACQMLVLLLSALLLIALLLDATALRSWLFALPLAAIGLMSARLAVPLAVTILVLALVGLSGLQGDPVRHQLTSPLALTAALAGLFFLLREYKARQLAPLKRTDELTQAASREYLYSDLYKEIQRSEREGLELSVVMIGLDTHLTEPHTDTDIQALLPRMGRYLHSRLRDFDSWYRVADLQFLVILPGMPTTIAGEQAEQIRQGLMSLLDSHSLQVTVSAGVAGLNIGDDANSLQHSVASALRSAQKKGGNRVQTWSAWSQAPQLESQGSETP